MYIISIQFNCQVYICVRLSVIYTETIKQKRLLKAYNFGIFSLNVTKKQNNIKYVIK